MASTAPLSMPVQPLEEPTSGVPVWRAPVFLLALAVTVGVVVDHHTPIPIAFSLVLASLCVLVGVVALASRALGLPLVYLLLACAALGAAWHHYRCRLVAADDYSLRVATSPQLVRVRGTIEEPFTRTPLDDGVWRGPLAGEAWYSVVRVEAIETADGWEPASGRLAVTVARAQPAVEESDTVELRGRIEPLAGPLNPGERDRERELLDQGITGRLEVYSAAAVTRLEPGWPGSWRGGVVQLRRSASAALQEAIQGPEGDLARALLLGDTHALDQAGWKKYTRTGVVHVLVISGQHLVVLACFAQFLFDLLRVRQRYSAVGIAVTLLIYGVLVGLEPPVLRAVVMVTAICGGRLLGRTSLTANSYALGWLTLLLLQPHDLFRLGCLFSFTAVAVLFWGLPRWLPRLEPTDPLDVLVAQTRPPWQRGARWLGRQLLYAYLINSYITLALLPLIVARTGQVPWTGLVIGPPVVLLTSIALMAGFLTLLLAVVIPPLAGVPAWLTGLCLQGCDQLVDLALLFPGARWTVGTLPLWWCWLFYLVLLTALWAQLPAPWWRRLGVGALGWLCFGLLLASVRWPRAECRVTFLAVGKGCCTVIETPDGRTIVYDAGSMFHPGVGRHIIVPYLRSRGIHRIDELILSHADLDHFNAVRDLLDEITIGQVTCSPTFLDKKMPQVGLFQQLLDTRGVPLRTVSAGDRLLADEVVLEVVHPPAEGPPGVENVRSLVLLLRHGRHVILLTGDLEGVGLDQVMTRTNERVDVLMAPHHGSPKNNPERLATHFRPALVVSSQGSGEEMSPEPYSKHGARYLRTDLEGAVTVRSHPSGLIVETFKANERYVLQRK